MIIFKEKQYTLQEGHYTGPKDMEEMPSTLKVVGGATLAGWTAGKVADRVTADSRKPVLGDEPATWATRGAEAGFVAGVMGKLLLNTMHNPMDTIKFNDLDQCLRREYGMYRAGGFTIGDSRENRDRMKDSFVINSKDLTSFRINVSITRGKFVMYTYALTPRQEEDLNESLDYYCKKYYGMKYTSTPIGRTKGSWSVTITFTNHQVAANFLVEVGNVLGTRINLLNNDISEEVSKSFSEVPALDKVELANIFGKGLLKIVTKTTPTKSGVLIEMIAEGLRKLKTSERASMGLKSPIGDYGNKFLETTLLKLDRSKGKWTIGENSRDLNMYLCGGVLIVCTTKGSKEDNMIKGIPELVQAESRNSASLFTYRMKSPGDLELVIKKIIGLGIKPNIYIP